ncbi:MAG TPA: undecaprenyl-diphosphate phosphatase [Candidatus Binatia bacterium]|nr:undecaprenyl-diphosphate phosphatase [Candidatus Binatia bacterium]
MLLGVVEGITEFLPVSSTGHLLIAEHWLGARSDMFNVAIQVGAILAVLVVYRRRLLDLDLFSAEQRAYVAKLAVSFVITVVGGLIAKKLGLRLPASVAPVAWAMIVGGVAILAIERRAAHLPPSDEITWRIAVWVGLAQVLAAVFPGTSRSAATIFAAILAGCTLRPAATEFAFLLGIPTMFAATAYELVKAPPAQESAGELALGFVVSGLVGFAVVQWLLRYIQTHRFTVFAWYRIVAGAALLLFL